MAVIYHITTLDEWNTAKSQGYYEAPSLATEGFIHCSEDHQVHGVLQRYYTGKANLVTLVIDTDKLQHRLQYDRAPAINEDFPHIYGAINIDAVSEVVVL